MTIKIGEKIKRLRHKTDVTQDKLAEYLGVTSQAVSRWESENCYPDLEMLPAIANFFNVTTDNLLGVDNMIKKERLDEIWEQMGLKMSKGLIDDCITICRTALNEFPNDFELLARLGFLLGKKDDTRAEAISVNERILRDCTDDNIRYGVMQKLAYDYKSIGEKDKAIEVAKKLPSTPVTSNMLLDSIYDGEERINQIKYNIMSFCDYIANDIHNFAYAKYTDNKDTEGAKKKIELFRKSNSLYELIYEDGNYCFYNGRLSDNYMSMAREYMTVFNDYDNALECIEKAAEYAIAFDTLPEVYTYTSIISEGEEWSKAKNTSKDYDYNDTYRLLQEFLSHERYNPIRDHDRFKAVVAKLEQYAAKEA